MPAGKCDYMCVHLPVYVWPRLCGRGWHVCSGSCVQKLGLQKVVEGWSEGMNTWLGSSPGAEVSRGSWARARLEAVCRSTKALISLPHQPPLFS